MLIRTIEFFKTNNINLLFALLLSFPLSVFISDLYYEDAYERYFVSEFTTDTNGIWEVFYDIGNGINSENSARVSISKNDNSLRLQLPNESIRALRIDPIDQANATMTISKMVVENKTHRSSLLQNLQDKTSSYRVETQANNDPQIHIKANDPIFYEIYNLEFLVKNHKLFISGLFIILFLSIVVLSEFVKTHEKRIATQVSNITISAISFLLKTVEIIGTQLKKLVSANTVSWVMVVALSASISIGYAIVNKYPVLFNDSGHYIWSAILMEVNTRRMFMYSLLIKITSGDLSLWPVLLFQGFIGTILIQSFIKSARLNNRKIINLFCITFLSIFTPYSVLTSQVMPDIFTGFTAALTTLIIVRDNSSSRETFFFSILFLISNLTHAANLLTSLVFSSILLLMCLLHFKTRLRKAFILFTLAVMSWPVSMFINTCVGASFDTMESSGEFFLGRLAEGGILQKYLNEEEDAKNYWLHKHRNQISTKNNDLLWNQKSALFELEQKERLAQSKQLTQAILTKPKYLGLFLWDGVKRLSEITERTLDGYVTMELTYDWTGEKIKKHFPHDWKSFLKSKQRIGELNKWLLTETQKYVLIGTHIIFLLYLFLLRKKANPTLILCFLLLSLYLWLNNYISVTLSTTTPRYFARVSWTLTLISLLITFDTVQRGKTFLNR